MQDLSYGFDSDGNITGITDLLDSTRSQTFQYDALNRLTYARGRYGALAYGYDAVGNRTSQSGGSTNLAETYSYATNSNQLQSVVNGTTTRSLSYTPTGNLASDDRGTGTVLGFTYDQSDRMVQVANQNQPLATYAYNFQGKRAAKTTASTITQFVYDRSGHLLAESDGTTGAAQTEYLWLDDMPLALVTGGNLYFIHPDHLNTPQKATDGAQTLAWDAVLRPFGQVEQQTFPPLTNLRFPGQYFDAESALHQNWFRDYDPSLGRYIQSDPIGLKGGINTYTYVRGNPTRLIDPMGWAGSPPPGVPYPPDNIPGGPWEWSPNPQNSRGGDFIGPKQPSGPRARCTYAPPGPNNVDPYWKTTDPQGNQQRYNMQGQPITPEEAHPRPGRPVLPGGLPVVPVVPAVPPTFLPPVIDPCVVMPNLCFPGRA